MSNTIDPGLKDRLTAFVRDCVTHGDMTPTVEHMLLRILDEYSGPRITTPHL